MTRDQFSQASEIVSKIRKLDNELYDLEINEHRIDKDGKYKDYNLSGITVNYIQIKSIINYNRAILNSRRDVLNNELSKI